LPGRSGRVGPVNRSICRANAIIAAAVLSPLLRQSARAGAGAAIADGDTGEAGSALLACQIVHLIDRSGRLAAQLLEAAGDLQKVPFETTAPFVQVRVEGILSTNPP
jgi:hypothetical protein